MAKKTAAKSKPKMKSKSKSRSNRKAKEASGDLSLMLDQQIWPCERDVLFRPDRFKYVRKIVQPKGCVFCEANKNPLKFEYLCAYQTEHSMVVLNKFPYNSGHVLVLPRRHCGDLLELTQTEFQDLQDLMRLSLKAIKEIYQPGGINLGLNMGSVAGAGIPDHLHYHLVPRWAGDLNFFPLIAGTKVVIESLEVSFQRLLEYFNKAEMAKT